jgi:hypothetical protein
MARSYWMADRISTLTSWWQDLNGPQRVFVLTEAGVLTVLLLTLIVAVFVDDMKIVAHLLVASVILSFLYLAYSWTVRFVSKQFYPKMERAGLWINASVFGVLTVVGWVPFTGIPKAIVNTVAIYALVPVLMEPFEMIYHWIYPVLFTGAILVLMLFGPLNWLIGSVLLAMLIPIDLYMLWPQRKKHELMLTEDEVERENYSRSTRVNLTVISVFTFVVSISLSVYWIILSMNCFWTYAEEVSKYETLHRFPESVSLHVHRVRDVSDLSKYKGMSTPVVIKPSVCTTSSRNVKVCRDYKCLVDYVTKHKAEKPQAQSAKLSWVVQDFCDKEEAVVFYYRYPYMKSGAIKNIGLRRAARNKGDKLSANYFPVSYVEPTPELVEFFDRMADAVPGYTGGRFDIMMESWEQAKKGRGIYILETNVFLLDSIDEKPHHLHPFKEALSRALRRFRTVILQFWFGIYNILAGYQRNLFIVLAKVKDLHERYVLCDYNHEHLIAKP